MMLLTRFLSAVLIFSQISCKTTRPTIDISENPKWNDQSAGSTQATRASPPFETPKISPNTDPEQTIESMKSEDTVSRFEPYGPGLYELVIGALQNKGISDLALAGGFDGVYAHLCKPFKGNERRVSGIEIEGGRLFGIELFFDNPLCEGKAIRTDRDLKSISKSDYDRTLATSKMVADFAEEGLVISGVNGDKTILNRLSFAESKLNAPVKAGELPIGVEVVKNGLGVLGFVEKTLGKLSESDRLIGDHVEYYASVCKLFGKTESYFEAIKVQGGLIKGANIFFGTRDCSGNISDSGTDSRGVSFADYASALRSFGTSASKLPEMILLSDRNADGYARQTILRKIPFAKGMSAPSILEGLGTTKYVTDAAKSSAKENDPNLKTMDGIYIRKCERFTEKTWKASGLYVASGYLYGLELYFPSAECLGKALGGASDQYAVLVANYLIASKKSSIEAEFEANKILLEKPDGTTVDYLRSSATLP